MTIKEKLVINRACFKSLKNGEIFKYEDEIYMKIPDQASFNAIALEDGILTHFYNEDEVIPPMENPVLNISFIDEL